LEKIMNEDYSSKDFVGMKKKKKKNGEERWLRELRKKGMPERDQGAGTD